MGVAAIADVAFSGRVRRAAGGWLGLPGGVVDGIDEFFKT